MTNRGVLAAALAAGLVAGRAEAQGADPMLAPTPESPAPAPAAPPAATGQRQRGFVGEVRLGSQFLALGTGGGVTIAGGAMGALFAGYKIDRFIFGLGFDITRFASGQGQTGSTDQSQADTTILFSPGVRAAILRSADQRVELFGQLDIGFGTSFQERSPAPANQPGRSVFRIGYALAPGLRFWIHPQFAFSAIAGLRGDFGYTNTTQTAGMMTITTSQSTGLTSIFAALAFTGVF